MRSLINNVIAVILVPATRSPKSRIVSVLKNSRYRAFCTINQHETVTNQFHGTGTNFSQLPRVGPSQGEILLSPNIWVIREGGEGVTQF
jgi:hypothetical protein